MKAVRITCTLLSLSIIAAASALADECTPWLVDTSSFGSTLSLTSSDLSSNQLQTAINYWNNNCGNMAGNDFPAMSVGSTGQIRVHVNFDSGRSPDTCGITRLFTDSRGRITSADVTLWAMDSGGRQCPTVDTLAHELGHVLGMDNATGTQCSGRIMGAAIIQDGQYQNRTVTSEDCMTVDELWSTSTEWEGSDPNGGDGGGPCAN